MRYTVPGIPKIFSELRPTICFSEWAVKSDRFALNKKNRAGFEKSIRHYFKNFSYNKSRENELSQDEFVKFWVDLYALFDKAGFTRCK